MIAISCQHTHSKKFGKTSSGAPRMRCTLCGKTWTESTDKLGGMRIGMDRAVKELQNVTKEQKGGWLLAWFMGPGKKKG